MAGICISWMWKAIVLECMSWSVRENVDSEFLIVFLLGLPLNARADLQPGYYQGTSQGTGTTRVTDWGGPVPVPSASTSASTSTSTSTSTPYYPFLYQLGPPPLPPPVNPPSNSLLSFLPLSMSPSCNYS